jgi:hypothetical protein
MTALGTVGGTGPTTPSDGRQIMSQVRIKNWEAVERDFPCDAVMAGDGPWLEHPRGSACSIAPAIDPDEEFSRCYRPIEIDLGAFVERVGMQALIRTGADSSSSTEHLKSE